MSTFEGQEVPLARGGNEEAWNDSELIKAYDQAISDFKKLSATVNKSSSKNNVINGYSKKAQSSFQKNAAKSRSGKMKWKVGDYCQAVYSEDGMLYEAQIREVHEKSNTVVVEFIGYGNREEVSDRNIRPSQGRSVRTKQEEVARNSVGSCSWKEGDYCQAVFSEDGIIYEGQIKKINKKKTACIVEFLGYDTDEEIDISDLIPSQGKEARDKQIAAAIPEKHDMIEVDEELNSLSTDVSSISEYDDRRPSHPKQQHHHHNSFRSTNTHHNAQSNGPSQHEPWPHCAPPMPFTNSAQCPPLPFPISCDMSSNNDALAAMLMSWYMAGYHTGYYEGQRSKTSAPDSCKHGRPCCY